MVSRMAVSPDGYKCPAIDLTAASGLSTGPAQDGCSRDQKRCQC